MRTSHWGSYIYTLLLKYEYIHGTHRVRVFGSPEQRRTRSNEFISHLSSEFKNKGNRNGFHGESTEFVKWNWNMYRNGRSDFRNGLNNGDNTRRWGGILHDIEIVL